MLETSRRKLLGAAMLGAGAALNSIGYPASATTLTQKGNIMLNRIPHMPKGLIEAANFPLIEAIHGRRSRRFAKGASIPDGPLAYTSTAQEPGMAVLALRRTATRRTP